MGKVIILVDFSKEAKNTVDYGIQFALEYDKEIEFLNTTLYSEYSLASSSSTMQEMEYRHFEKAKESFNSLIFDLSQRYNELPEIDIEIQYGIKTELIKKVFEEKNASLIITSGRLKNNSLLMMTDENKTLVENCNCPIMMIPPETNFKSYRKMVYATDYNDDKIYLERNIVSANSTLQNISFGIHLANSRIAYHNNNERGFREIINQNLNYDHFQIDTNENEDIAETILEYADIKGADIIAVTKQNQEILDSFGDPKKIGVLPEIILPLLIFQNN